MAQRDRSHALLRDVISGGGKGRWDQLRQRGHYWPTVQRCVDHGWLCSEAWNNGIEITEAGRAEVGNG